MTEAHVLVIGDVVGRPGRNALVELLPDLREEHDVACCIVNGENAAGGAGITASLVDEILEAGADIITTGDHAWDDKRSFDMFESRRDVLRPLNYPEGSPGIGATVVTARDGIEVGVINLQGRVFMNPLDCPFKAADAAIGSIAERTKTIFVDLHAEATSEKRGLGWHLDGRISCLFGTHTHVQTADEEILPMGTAYISDLGMTGPYHSVLGRDKRAAIRRLAARLPTRLEVASDDVRLCGALVTVDIATGRATAIERIDARLEDR